MAHFCKLKDSLCNHVVLTIPGPEDELVLYTPTPLAMASVVVSMS